MRLLVDDKKLYHRHIMDSPLSEMRISFFAGARFDGDKPGLAHFTEHAMFCGTSNRKEAQINKEIELLGGFINASTGRETVSYYVQGISENFSAISEILVDIVNNSTFPYGKLKRERGAIEREIALRNTIDSINEDAINGHFFGEDFGTPLTGTMESVGSVKRKDIVNFARANYANSTCVIGIVGDVDREEAERLVRELNLSSEHERPDLSDEFTPPEPSQGYYKIGEINPEDELILSMRWPCPPMGNKNNPAIDLLAQILSEGASSRFDHKLRTRHGISYGTSMYTIKHTDRGCITLEGNFSRNDLEKAIDIIMKEIKHIKKYKISDDELTINRNKLLFDIKQSSMYPILQNQDETLAYLFDLNTPDYYSRRMMEVGKEDILEIANQIFDINPVVYLSN